MTIAILNGHDAKVGSVEAGFGPAAITIKRLGWGPLERAERAHRKQAFAQLQEMGGAEVIKSIREARGKEEEPVAPDIVGSRYDRATLLALGVVKMDGVDPTDEALEALEPETVEAVTNAIVRLSRPALFVSEAAAKNG